ETLRRQPERVARVHAAHGAAGARRERDEVGRRAALDAAREMRQVARDPEQLQLEAQHERIGLGLCHLLFLRVERLEEPRECRERALAGLRLAEQTEHRLGADQADVQLVRVLTRAAVRVEQLDAGDGLELARALVEHQLDVRQRLEPRAEARLRLPHAFCDRADPPALARVQVQDPVGLGEAERAQHDRLGLVRPGHAASLEAVPAGNPRRPFSVVTNMARVQMYTTSWCGYCVRAKALLQSRGIEYEEIRLDDDAGFRARLNELTGGWTVPQILIDGTVIGGYTELWRLDREGRLDELLAA